ncbi:MAG: hypothetical protein ABSD43_07280 [Terracidiphilus sp.]|jgi:hypothetical protein
MRLPVSGLGVGFHAPDGNDDLAILEAAGSAVERALAVLPRLVQAPEMASDAVESRGPWAALTVTDFETALLGLRRFLFGDTIACLFRDRSHKCGAPMELEFSIAAFLGEASPRMPRGVRRSEEDPRWFHLPGDAALFRLPTVEDQLQVLDEPRAATLLARRCVKSLRPGTRALARAERAMEAMAPLVSRPLAGSCPECGETVTMPLNVPRLVMDELRARAAGVHEEIHVIAAAYHWAEAAILAMPQSRRRAYAETIRRRERVTE